MNTDATLTATEVQPLEHLGLVHWCAGKIKTKYYDREDLVQIGVVGLLDAVSKYDPSRGVKFSTYAVYRIRGAIQEAIREADRDHRACLEVWRASVTSQYTRSSCDFITYKARREVA